MSPETAVTEVLHVGGDHLPRLLADVERRLLALAGDAGPVTRHGEATIAAGGKRLRPLLVLLAAGEEPEDPRDLVRVAAAVELVHSATLVHDDVLDDAPLRRGHPTVYAQAGRAAALCTGDLLFARAFADLAAAGRTEEIRVLSEASSALALGELLQRADAWNTAITLERYLRRCDLKTARLFQAACRLGAMQTGGPAGALGTFGARIGLAFQLLDDVLDVSGPAERTGKHRGTDLLDGTVTLPFILARDHDPELAALDPRAITTPERAEEVCDAIAATGALEESRTRALGIVAEAKADLPASLPEAQHAAMVLVADGVVARYA